MGAAGKELNTQYLQNYAEIEALSPALLNIESVDAVLVIPAYRESPAFLHRLLNQSFVGIQKLLLILVSNHPDNLTSTNLKPASDSHKNLMSNLPNASWVLGPLEYYEIGKISVLMVNKTGAQALDAKHGVGLARKIGADIALALFTLKKVKTPWIFNTDADAHVSQDYFSVASSIKKSAAAIIFPYKYIGPPGPTKDITKLYEAKLNHYVAGLKLAGSPYAFQTIGSTIAVSPEAYAQVRGFPRRAAGEDFYLLNKLAKIGEIRSLSTPKIELDCRCSDRIPFGTGPAVGNLLNSVDPLAEKIFYHPLIFNHLKLFLETLTFSDEMGRLAELPDQLQSTASSVGIENFFKHAEIQRLSGDQYHHHFHLWFDGFKTLKFIHFFRDNYLPNISYKELKNFESPKG